MDQLKRLFPFSFSGNAVRDLVVAIIVYLVIGVVAGIICWVIGIIPLIGGFVAWLLRALSGLYVLVGLVLSVLHYFGTV